MNCQELIEILKQDFSSDLNNLFEQAIRELKFYEGTRLETSHLFLAILRRFPGLLPVTMQEFRETLGPGNLESQIETNLIEVSKTIETVVSNSMMVSKQLGFAKCINPILLYNFFQLENGYHIQYLQERKVNVKLIADQQYRSIYSVLIQVSPTMETKFNAFIKYIDIEFANINSKLNQLMLKNQPEE